LKRDEAAVLAAASPAAVLGAPRIVLRFRRPSKAENGYGNRREE